MVADFIERIPTRYWVILAFLVWGGLALLMLRHDAYGLDEGALRALLLNWTIVDNVTNPIVIFGVPDFRALLFIPLGIYWSGSLLAAKVFTGLICFIAAVLLYQNRARNASREVALLASGLLLISPIAIQQIDALGAGPYLLLLFSLGAWLDHSYRANNYPLGGNYFMQMLLVAVTVTLHPAGLAYPLALAWRWYKQPLAARTVAAEGAINEGAVNLEKSVAKPDLRQQRHVFIGIFVALLFAGLLQAGWHGLEWWINPLLALVSSVSGPQFGELSSAQSVLGAVLIVLLLAVLWLSRKPLRDDLLGSILLLSVLFGLASANTAWAMLVITILLFYGIPQLIALNQMLGSNGFKGQRGGVMVAVFLIATLFMNIDKAYFHYIRSDALSPHDQLIRILAEEAQDADKSFRAASEWPARTLIAVKREVLPLPPAAKDGAALLKLIPGVTHLLFDAYQPRNRALAENLAELSGPIETFALQAGGVVMRVRTAVKAAAEVPNAGAAGAGTGAVAK